MQQGLNEYINNQLVRKSGDQGSIDEMQIACKHDPDVFIYIYWFVCFGTAA